MTTRVEALAVPADDAKEEFIDRLIDEGVDAEWAATYVASRGDAWWEQYLSLPENLQSSQWIIATQEFRRGTGPKESADAFAPEEKAAQPVPEPVPEPESAPKSEELKEAERRVEEAAKTPGFLDDADAAFEAAIAAGETGEGLLDYDDALRRIGKLNDLTGSLTDEAGDELLAGMRANWDRYGDGKGDAPSNVAEAVSAFNSFNHSERYSLFGTIWEAERAQWRMMDVPGIGEVRVLNSEEDDITRVLPDVSSPMVDEAAVSAAGHNVDWRFVLLAAEAADNLYTVYDLPENKGPGHPGSGFAPENLRGRSFDVLAEAIAEGEGLYSGSGFAGFIHAVNPALAEVAFNTPSALTAEQGDQLAELTKRFTSENQRFLPGKANEVNWLRDDLIPRVQSRKPLTSAVSEDDVRESMRSLWKSWFLEDPSEGDLVDFVAHFNAQQSDYADRLDRDSNPFRRDRPKIVDAAPTLAATQVEYLRSTSDYESLFGARPSGMSEEAYVAAMRTKASSMLGAAEGALAVDAVKAGMRSGDPNAVGRQAVMSGSAYDSSTFMGNLAAAANRFKEML